jgi:tetratricopeptide (TPR) repeat protein
MGKKRDKAPRQEAEAEFNRLFWAARKEHSRLRIEATADHPDHKAALAFASAHGWKWAEVLLEASRLDWAGAHDEALALLTDAEPSIPRRWYGLLHFVRGAALDFTGKYDEAIKAYRMALDNPKCDWRAYAWFNIGNTLANKGEYDEAIMAYRKALDDRRFDVRARAWTNLAHVYVATHRRTQAQEAFEKALEYPDPIGGDQARARAGLRLLKSNIETDALSPDDRALATGMVSEIETNELESGMIAAIQEAGDTQYEKYVARPDSKRDDTLCVLRGWCSAVTLLEGSARRWRGGGYFLKWRGRGIVIDPGFDFLRNFHDAGYHGREVAAVAVSHNHSDHNSDLKAIDDLRYELFKRLGSTKDARNLPYVLLWDQDTDGATSFGIEKAQHHHEPVVLASGFPQPINLRDHAAKIPVRLTPFKVSHASDVPHAMGMLLELLDKKGKPALRIGYTADTAYFPDLPRHLSDCDVLIAHISQPTIEELQDASKLKEVHLGYRGTARLLKECKPKLALIGEFWAGFADLRISLIKGLRQRSGVDAILPAGLGMHLRLPSLDIECTQCGKPSPFSQVRIAPPADNFGSLAYLCPKCMIG